MPIHFEDLDVMPEVSGLKSVLIVPCIMCPATTLAIRDKKPVMQIFRSLVTSAPLEQYIKDLQARLIEKGLKAKVFKSYLYQQWFLCMWSSSRRKKLQKCAKQYEAVIVLGCDSALETVRDSLKSTDCKIVEGMRSAGLTNARLRFKFPGNVCFESVKILPMPQQK